MFLVPATKIRDEKTDDEKAKARAAIHTVFMMGRSICFSTNEELEDKRPRGQDVDVSVCLFLEVVLINDNLDLLTIYLIMRDALQLIIMLM